MTTRAATYRRNRLWPLVVMILFASASLWSYLHLTLIPHAIDPSTGILVELPSRGSTHDDHPGVPRQTPKGAHDECPCTEILSGHLLLGTPIVVVEVTTPLDEQPPVEVSTFEGEPDELLLVAPKQSPPASTSIPT